MTFPFCPVPTPKLLEGIRQQSTVMKLEDPPSLLPVSIRAVPSERREPASQEAIKHDGQNQDSRPGNSATSWLYNPGCFIQRLHELTLHW